MVFIGKENERSFRDVNRRVLRMDRKNKITNKIAEEKEGEGGGKVMDKNESGAANCLGKRKKGSRTRQGASTSTRSCTNWSLDKWLENCMHPDSGISNSSPSAAGSVYNHTPLSYSTPDTSALKNGPGSPPSEHDRENAPKLPENLQGAADMEKNRFSDLGMTSMSDNDSKERDEEDELSPTSSRDLSNNTNTRPQIDGATAKDGKLLVTLLEQISLLHDTNAKICRNLHETKVEIEALKHAPNWNLRHRRDSSVSGFSTHSQPLGYVFGTHSPAPTYHSGMYTPGMVTDVIREVRDGARIREEAMIHKVKSMLEENSWAMSEMKIKMMMEMEELKREVQHLRSDKKELSNKVVKMENEIEALRTMVNSHPAKQQQKSNNSVEGEKHLLNNSHVNYGVIKQEEGEFYEVDIVSSPGKKYSPVYENRVAKPVTVNADQNRFYTPQVLNNGSNRPLDVTKNFSSGHLVQQEKDTLELRRELQDAIAGKKNAEKRILDLERTVANLQKGTPSRSSPPTDGSSDITTNSSTAKSAERHSSHVKIDLESPISSKNSTIIPIASQIQSVVPKGKVCLTGMVTDL
uniref:Putative alpha-protein kinase 1 n=1 Tax=Lutzomyia longipalpis TaxID=7200 RepID=A0A7G3A837_LUTLO